MQPQPVSLVSPLNVAPLTPDSGLLRPKLALRLPTTDRIAATVAAPPPAGEHGMGGKPVR